MPIVTIQTTGPLHECVSCDRPITTASHPVVLVGDRAEDYCAECYESILSWR